MGSYLNPCGPQQFKVYNRTVDFGVQTVIYMGAALLAFGAPSEFKGSYIDGGDNYPENDRVTLKADGLGFSDKYPHQIYMQDGTQVGDLDAVKAYFDELGIGVQSGGGGGITPEQLQELIDQVAGLEERVSVLENGGTTTTIINLTQDTQLTQDTLLSA